MLELHLVPCGAPFLTLSHTPMNCDQGVVVCCMCCGGEQIECIHLGFFMPHCGSFGWHHWYSGIGAVAFPQLAALGLALHCGGWMASKSCASHTVVPMWHMTQLGLATTTHCTTAPPGGGGSKRVVDASGSRHSLAVTGMWPTFPSGATSPALMQSFQMSPHAVPGCMPSAGARRCSCMMAIRPCRIPPPFVGVAGYRGAHRQTVTCVAASDPCGVSR